MKSRNYMVLPMLVGLLASCASSQKQQAKIDTIIDVKGSVEGAELGLNHNNQVVLQEQQNADQELKTQLWVNNKLNEDLAYERFQLQRCRDDLADPRLGGHGFASEVPETVDTQATFDEEKIGLDQNGNYKVVRRQNFVERLKWERERAKNMKEMLKVVQSIKRECEQKMRIARIKHGLSPSRYEPQGYFADDGTWVLTQKGEETLDDAFYISAKLKGGQKNSSPE